MRKLEEKEKKEEETEKEEEKKEEPEEEKPQKKSNKLPVVLIIIVVVLVGLYFLGRGISRKIGEGVAGGLLARITGKNVKVDKQGEKITVTDEDQQVSFEQGGDLPEGFPKDFPVYPGASLASSFSAKGENGDGVSVVWETADAFNKVADFYKKELQKGGWTIQSSYEQEDSLTTSFKKGEVEGFVGVTVGDKGKTTISATIGVK